MSNQAESTSPSWQPGRGVRSALLEITVLAIVVPEAMALAQPQMAQTLLPLQTLIPILFAIRYGFVAGMSAALLLTLIAFQLSYFPPQVLPYFPKVQATVYVLAAGIAGQFHDRWKRKLEDMRMLAEQDRLRLAQFSGKLHLLQASHGELERQLGATRSSLRASMQRLKDQLMQSQRCAGQPLACIGACLLQILAESCRVQACAVYGIKDGALDTSQPVATFGIAAELLPTNPLLREALDSGRVVSVRANHESMGQVLAVVPLADSLGHIHGVVGITHMPFIAIHQHTFDLMAIIARQAGDILSSYASLYGNPGDRELLLGRIRQSMDMTRFQRMRLAIVILKVIEPADADQLLARCLETVRGVDQLWFCRDRHGSPSVVMLMPMPDEEAARAQVERLHDHVAARYGTRVAREGIEASTIVLPDGQGVEEAFAAIFRCCDVHSPQRRLRTVGVLAESVS